MGTSIECPGIAGFEPCAEVPERLARNRESEWDRLVRDFWASGERCVSRDCGIPMASRVATLLRNSAKREALRVRVSVRGTTVYLSRDDG